MLGVRVSSFLLMVGMLFLQGLSGQTSPRHKTTPDAPKEQSAQKILFNHIPSELGLSQNAINCMLQDTTGFLWVGTKDGLNRFDGYGFKVYRYDPSEPTSLSDSNITSLFEDHLGRMWVGTENGLNLFDRTRESFYHILPDSNNQISISHHRIRSITEDQKGAHWIGTAGGLNKLELLAGKSENPLAGAQFTHFLHDPNNPDSLDHNDIQQVLVDDGGVILVKTGSGKLYTLTAGATHSYVIKQFRIEGEERAETVLNFCKGRNGKIWLAGKAEIFEWDSVARRATFHRYDSVPELLNQTLIAGMLEDSNGNIWFGSYWGLSRFHPGTEKFDFFPSNQKANPERINPLFEYGVNSILEDRGGALWFGTNGKGLVRYDRQAERFAHSKEPSSKLSVWHGTSVRSLFETDDGTMLVSSAGGWLLRVNRTTGESAPFQVPVPGRGVSEDLGVYTMLQDRTGAVWLGGLHPLLKLDWRNGNAGKITLYSLEPDKAKNPYGHIVNKLFEDRAGDLWAVTSSKLFRFNRETDSFTGYLFDTRTFQEVPYDNYADICEDSKGIFWIGTTDGLVRFDRNRETFKRYRNKPQDSASLSHNVVRTIVQDPFEPHVLWLGTAGGGLNRFDSETETFSVLTEKDGLPNNVVYGILSDEEGNLWMSTNNGISRFTPRTRAFKNFDKKDGLQENEFNSCAFFKSRSEELFFGGINGFNAFYPSEVKDNPKPPHVVFTDFQILNRPVSFKTPDSPLKQSITETREISLSYEHRFFSFEFAALDFTEPSKNQYAYKLEGFDHDWVQNGKRRTAFYTNVPPGSYTFQVIAANNDGVWNKQGASIRITVLPPFWRTWWFLSFLTVVVVGLVFWLFRRRVSQLERAKALQEAFARQLIEDQENDRKRIAAELHDGLGQSLLIIKNRAFLGSKATEKESVIPDKVESAHEQFGEISDSAAEALEQVREIAYYLRPSQLERLGLASAIEEMLERVSDSSGIVFEVQLAQLDGVFPPEHEINFYRIVQESINNILKHSGATSAKVSIKKDENGVELLIQDNGKGFMPGESGTIRPGKPGFGLKGMAERARILGGRYEVNSTPGQGTAIVVQIENQKCQK